jgi:DNA-binding SARP family transcriptional activator
MLCYLAVHDDRSRSVDDTQTALWPTAITEADVSRKTFLNHVSEVRRAVGSEHFPYNARRSGYRLAKFTTDWHEFRSLADRAASERGAEGRRLRAKALSLVRGVPFESELSKWFQWTDSEGLRTAITKAIVKVAGDAHTECVHADDLDGAESALRQGLLACPTELSLWSCLVDVVQARGDHGDLQRFWLDAGAVLDAAAIGLLEARVRG